MCGEKIVGAKFMFDHQKNKKIKLRVLSRTIIFITAHGNLNVFIDLKRIPRARL